MAGIDSLANRLARREREIGKIENNYSTLEELRPRRWEPLAVQSLGRGVGSSSRDAAPVTTQPGAHSSIPRRVSVRGHEAPVTVQPGLTLVYGSGPVRTPVTGPQRSEECRAVDVNHNFESKPSEGQDRMRRQRSLVVQTNGRIASVRARAPPPPEEGRGKKEHERWRRTRTVHGEKNKVPKGPRPRISVKKATDRWHRTRTIHGGPSSPPEHTVHPLPNGVPILSDREPILEDNIPILPERVPILPERVPILPERVPILPDRVPLAPVRELFIRDRSDTARDLGHTARNRGHITRDRRRNVTAVPGSGHRASSLHAPHNAPLLPAERKRNGNAQWRRAQTVHGMALPRLRENVRHVSSKKSSDWRRIRTLNGAPVSRSRDIAPPIPERKPIIHTAKQGHNIEGAAEQGHNIEGAAAQGHHIEGAAAQGHNIEGAAKQGHNIEGQFPYHGPSFHGTVVTNGRLDKVSEHEEETKMSRTLSIGKIPPVRGTQSMQKATSEPGPSSIAPSDTTGPSPPAYLDNVPRIRITTTGQALPWQNYPEVPMRERTLQSTSPPQHSLEYRGNISSEITRAQMQASTVESLPPNPFQASWKQSLKGSQSLGLDDPRREPEKSKGQLITRGRRLRRSVSYPEGMVSRGRREELSTSSEGAQQGLSPRAQKAGEGIGITADNINPQNMATENRRHDNNRLGKEVDHRRSRSLPPDLTGAAHRPKRTSSIDRAPLRYFAYLGKRFQYRDRLYSTHSIARPVILTSTSVVSTDVTNSLHLNDRHAAEQGFHINCHPNEDWDAAIDCCTCMCCVKGMLYHCTKDGSTEGKIAEEPCACSAPHCCVRWTALGVLSLILPCLCCFLPLQSCRKCADHGHETPYLSTMHMQPMHNIDIDHYSE